jgi:uncharacterized protein
MARTRRARPRLSADAARRIALAAQGLARPRPARADAAAVRRVLGQIQLIQIDSVNVLVRTQELPLWARLGAHDRGVLPRLHGRRRLFEYWGHMASLIPIDLQPDLRWRMKEAMSGDNVWGAVARLGRDQPDYVARVLAEFRDRGGLAASQLTDAEAKRIRGPWWSWGDHKRATEYLFWTGQLAVAHRLPSFERVYDLPERVLPPATLRAPTPDPADAHRALLRRAAGALGVATAADLADYFRIRKTPARARVAELVDAGELVAVEVEGWREPGLVDPDAAEPRRAEARTLVSPFDSLVWDRARTERLFDFHYRIEIYTPPGKRRFGYYVLPFLLGDRLVARVDLKADRAAGALAVRGVFAEPGVERRATAAALADELRAMAGWLELDRVTVAAKGDLARDLRAAMRPRR